MEEEKIEEIQEEAESPSTSEETSEEESKEQVDTEDTSFTQELEELQKKEKPQYTDIEKAERALYFNAERLKQLGGDPSKVIKIPEKKEEYVTKEDMAESYARSLAKSDSELQVVMWQYRNGIQRTGNLHQDIDNAYWLAHKTRIRKTYEEIERIEKPPVMSGGAGQRVQRTKAVEMPIELQKVFSRRGFKPNKDGVWEAKHNKAVFDSVTKQWVTVRKTN